MYKVIRNNKYDFAGSSYSDAYPNLHKYPATMLPQIGIDLFKEFDIKANSLLDPYCGSGSSFTVGLDRGVKEMYGFDLNPLAVLISKAKFTKLLPEKIESIRKDLRYKIYDFIKHEKNIIDIEVPQFFNIDFWFSKNSAKSLTILKKFIDEIELEYRGLFLLPFSETARECSYTRNNEFKLYKMKEDDVLSFNPDVYAMYFYKLQVTSHIYSAYYLPKLHNIKRIEIKNDCFYGADKKFDVVLTSPPYGDSKTTVAYGQFSFFGNQWIGIKDARKVDNMLMGGTTVKDFYSNGIMQNYICEIAKKSKKRALEVSSFYFDLEKSIKVVAKSINKKGKAIYIVGNRCVKDIQLPTDQFVAEQFEYNGFKHCITYERVLGNKSMPLKNSPTNIAGQRKGTMTKEYIVVCEKQ